MVWRFRKSFSPLPGVRLTVSPRGISTSVGAGPLRFTVGSRGPAFIANIPGTGLSFRQSFESGGQRAATPQDAFDPSSVQPPTRNLEGIVSAGSGALTTSGLEEFKLMLEKTRLEYRAISLDLAHWRIQAAAASQKYLSWERGWLLRRLLKEKFKQLRATTEEFSARRMELEEQERLSRLQTQLDLPQGVTHAFHRLCDEFALVAKSQYIWDTVGHRSTNRVAERTTASRVIDRKPIKFRLEKCELIETEWNVPHLENANGGDIYFYPVFALYFVTSESFALLEYEEIKLAFDTTRFIEEDAIPTDSKVVGSTWAKTNKDGSPDRRFSGNHEIPIAQYGKLLITSPTGMNEEYMISNAETAEAFAKAWQTFSKAVNLGV